MLDKEMNFYRAHQDELVAKHHGKFLVIRGEEVVGVYDSDLQAYTEAKKRYELGSFLIQQSLTKEEEPVQVFHSRVAI